MTQITFDPFNLTLAQEGRQLVRSDGVLASEWHYFPTATTYRQLVVVWQDKDMRSYNIQGEVRGSGTPLMGLVSQRYRMFVALLSTSPPVMSEWFLSLAALQQAYPEASQGYKVSIALDGSDPDIEYLQK